MAHPQIIRAVEHAAVGVATAVDEVAVTLSGSDKHAGAFKLLGNQRFGRLGAEVSQEDHQGVAAGGLHVLHSLEHVQLIFHGDGALVEILAPVGLDDIFPALGGQGNGEAVPGDGDDAQLDGRDVGT